MASPRPHVLLVAALVALGLGCQAVAPARPTSPGRPGASRAVKPRLSPALARPGEPRRVPQQGQQTRLTGLARLIAHPGAPLISDQGGALISDQGGALISDQGGALISNNGGTVLSDQGGSLVSNNGGGVGPGRPATRRVLQASPGLGVYGLADAEIRLYDAAGRLLVDDAGKPLTATTGRDATFQLEAVLPPGNLVARIQLWNGGELSAIVARDGAQQASLALTTASSLGASYVLGLVKGDQAILDKLPRAESDRLNRELDVVRGFAKGAFKHEAATLDAITAKLRLRVPAVEQVAEDIRALLLGQDKLGAGLEAAKVPLAGPLHLTVSREGRLLIGEQLPGRVRELQADGTLAMWLDKTHGRVSNNAPTMEALSEGPDGQLYVAVRGPHRVYRIPRAGEIAVALGSGKVGRDAPGTPTEMAVLPSCVAAG
ncbi:MAG: hypothetical protein VKQ33_02315, partial [Candidatus Sericytochromatia bacterium]|nr:hypothetical protein [Candidatus Sericytochromatia bacterium]